MGETKAEVQEMVQRLLDTGMTVEEIAVSVDNRVSVRTVYRWARGECYPQNWKTRELLEKLVGTRG